MSCEALPSLSHYGWWTGRGVVGPCAPRSGLSALSQGRLSDVQEERREGSGGELVLRSGLGGLDLLLSVALVQLHELGKIELGLLENLDLLDADVLKREDLGALLRDFLGNGLGQAKLIY